MFYYFPSFNPITGWPRTIMFERSIVPRRRPAVSPPSSPREEGEEDDYIQDYDIVLILINIFDAVAYTTHHETLFWKNQHFSIQKNGKRNYNSKSMRRLGKLKQPGGSSCNQRR